MAVPSTTLELVVAGYRLAYALLPRLVTYSPADGQTRARLETLYRLGTA